MAKSGEVMRAVIMENIGGPRVLNFIRMTRPSPGSGEALVKVHATSINPCDLHYRRGRFILRKPMPHILGVDLAGEIVALGEDVDGWEVGERVCACFENLGRAIDGSYAEYCRVPAAELARMPADLDFQSAVGAGASFADAYLALVTNGKLKKADTVVVRGAAGPVGAAAVQIARARGAKVIAISDAAFAARVHEFGADIVLEDAGDDLVRQVKVATDESGASLVLHCLNKLDLSQSLDMLAFGGRLVMAAAVFKTPSKLNAMDLYLRNLTVLGAYGSLKPKDLESILGRVAKGAYRPVIADVMPLSQARQAHRKLERRPGFGKIVLVPDAVLAAEKKPANWVPIE